MYNLHMNKSYEKYFVIGFNKTATSTFHNLFKKNNLKSQHKKSQFWNTSKYDCFSDIRSGDDIWKKLDKKYKNAIFILNVRELDKWLISRFKHGLRNKFKFGRQKKNYSDWAYPCTHELCSQWIYLREKTHLEILNFFSERPNKLIIINIDRKGWEKFLCSQLNFKNDNVDSKNINKTQNIEEHRNIVNIVDQTLNKLNYDKKTILFPNKELLNKYTTIYNNYI